MAKFKDTYRIESTRLPEYDYSRGGYYFVTICTNKRENLFGRIENGVMKLNEAGDIVEKWLVKLNEHFPYVANDYYSIMPNHLHIIIIINEEYKYRDRETLSLQENKNSNQCRDGVSPSHPTLGNIVAYLKYQSSKQINLIRNTPGKPIWQPNYYEHIIRNEKSLYEIRKYIQNNPLEWEDDEYFTDLGE
jgi:REP element-mobilizing transposase RayT